MRVKIRAMGFLPTVLLHSITEDQLKHIKCCFACGCARFRGATHV